MTAYSRKRFISVLLFGFMLFVEAKRWLSASPGEEAQWQTTLPAPHPPQSAPSFLIHLTATSHSLVPPLTTSKHCFTHYPWAGAGLLWTTLTFRRYLEPLGHQGQHLTYIFTASGSTGVFYFHTFIFSSITVVFLLHTAHRALNCSLAGASGARTC